HSDPLVCGARGAGAGLRRSDFTRLGRDLLTLRAAATLALLPLALDLVRLLADFPDRGGKGRFPGSGVADAVQEFFSARVQRDVGAVPVLFARQHGLGRNGAVVQEPLQFAELAVHETADGG